MKLRYSLLLISLISGNITYAEEEICPNLVGRFKSKSEGHTNFIYEFTKKSEKDFDVTLSLVNAHGEITGTQMSRWPADSNPHEVEEVADQFKRTMTITCHTLTDTDKDSTKALTVVYTKVFKNEQKPVEYSIRTFSFKNKNEIEFRNIRINSLGQVLDPLSGQVSILEREK